VTFKSADSFRDFDRAVRREFRYVRTPQQEEFLRTLAATSHSRSRLMRAGFLLWRAQLGHDWREDGQGEVSVEVHAAYPPVRMKPLAEKASDGRANPKGVPCLYLATQKETAVLEVRPLIGSYVSVAQFKVLKDLHLVDCSAKEMGNLERFFKADWSPEDTEKQVWTDISRAFSEPVERGDDSLDYIPTQIITETFKLAGFDGIAYKSSYGENGFNVALFDVEAADVISSSLYRIDNVFVSMKKQDGPYCVSKYYPAPAATTLPPAPDADAAR
jgi:hypothetical protein